MEKSLYEMTQEELQEFSPQDFNQAVIKEHAPLVEKWRKTPWMHPNVKPAFQGRTQLDRDLNEATMARILQNYVDEAFGGRIKGREGHRYAVEVEDAMKLMEQFAPKDSVILERSLTETVSTAQTTAWSGATLLPVVLGMVRKILPKSIALQFYSVQPLDRPTGRVFYLARNRDKDGTTDGQVEQRAGYSYRSWATTPGEATTITRGVTFTITSSDVAVTNNKMLAKTGFELEQDLRSYFGMDAVALVSEIAADELAIETDERLLKNLYYEAVANGVGQFQYGHLSVPTGHTQESWDKRLLEIINRAAMAVYTTKRVIPNYLIGGAEWEIRLSNIPNWMGTQDATPGIRGPVSLSGSVLGTQVATAVFPWPTTEAIMGYKGTSLTDSNAIYFPYLPITLYAIAPDPITQIRSMSWLQRDGILNNRFSGEKEAYAWLTFSTGVSGLSYPADVTYTG